MSSSSRSPRRLEVHQSRLPLALWDYGIVDGKPPVLFLHGFLDSARSFEDLATELAGDIRPLCLDWRGHGESAWAHADAGYHQLDHLRDLLCVLEELAQGELAPQLVVAHSMGGTLALMAAAFAPTLLPRLMVLDSLGGYPVTPPQRLEQMRAYAAHVVQPARDFRPFATREEAIARIQHNNPGLSAVGAERMARHYFREEDGMLLSRQDPRLRGPNPYRFSEGDWLALLAGIACPVHVIAPEHGYLHRHDVRARMESLAQGTRSDIEGIGHHVHVECPQRIAEEIRSFLG